MIDVYSFCESIAASGRSPWHIRRLTEVGRKLGGGADTPALCGREMAWDISVEVADQSLVNACATCRSEYLRLKGTT